MTAIVLLWVLLEPPFGGHLTPDYLAPMPRWENVAAQHWRVREGCEQERVRQVALFATPITMAEHAGAESMRILLGPFKAASLCVPTRVDRVVWPEG